MFSAIPFAVKQGKLQDQILDEAGNIMVQEVYDAHCQNAKKRLKESYLKGEISSIEYAEKVREMSTVEYVAEHISNDKMQQLQKDARKTAQIGASLSVAGAGVSFAGIVLMGASYVSTRIAERYKEDQDEELENE